VKAPLNDTFAVSYANQEELEARLIVEPEKYKQAMQVTREQIFRLWDPKVAAD
jgi:hypothetical protein